MEEIRACGAIVFATRVDFALAERSWENVGGAVSPRGWDFRRRDVEGF